MEKKENILAEHHQVLLLLYQNFPTGVQSKNH